MVTAGQVIVRGLAKVVDGIALPGFAMIELGSPLWTKAQLDDAGVVHVTVSKRAKSYVLHNFEKTRSWYEVHLRATAQPAGR